MTRLPHRLPVLLGMTLTAAAFGTHTYAADTMQDMDIHGMRAAAVHVPDGTASADAPPFMNSPSTRSSSRATAHAHRSHSSPTRSSRASLSRRQTAAGT